MTQGGIAEADAPVERADSGQPVGSGPERTKLDQPHARCKLLSDLDNVYLVTRDGGDLITMTDATYAVTEIVGTSPDGIDTAIQNGLTKAAESLRNLGWFEVTEIRGQLGSDGGTVQHFQVTLKVGFRYED